MGKLEKDFIDKTKYHFRYYRPGYNHPFIIVLVKQNIDESGQVLLSGFNMTHSTKMMLKRPNEFIEIKNPNPNDDSECYVYVRPIKNKPLKLFSNPIKDWFLSEKDENLIDDLVMKRFDVFIDDSKESLDK